MQIPQEELLEALRDRKLYSPIVQMAILSTGKPESERNAIRERLQETLRQIDTPEFWYGHTREEQSHRTTSYFHKPTP